MGHWLHIGINTVGIQYVEQLRKFVKYIFIYFFFTVTLLRLRL